MKDYKELKKTLNDYKLVSNVDYLIACGKTGFTDLRFTKLDKKLNEDSKYYLAIDIDNKPTLLYHPNLLHLRKEIDEKTIKLLSIWPQTMINIDIYNYSYLN